MAHRTSSLNQAQQTAFFKIGGTWDMVKNDLGRLSGVGGLDDHALTELENRLESDSIESSEKNLFQEMTHSVEQAISQPAQISDKLGWVPHIKKYVIGQYYSLYSGDSSHMRSSLMAPLISTLLHYANEHPDIQVIGAQGTDTADSALLPFLDVFLFDTELKPILLTGANRSQHEWNSDAPKNFSDLIQLSGAHLPAGAYWVFGSHLYRASDMLKIDPTESRRIENFTTFFAPRLTSQFTKKVIGENSLHHPSRGQAVGKSHPLKVLSGKKLFDAMNEIDVVDLGNFNPVSEDITRILAQDKRAVVICAFALGNGNNLIKKAIIRAVNRGKIVTIVDRTLLGVVSGRYEAGLIWASSGSKPLSGHKMNQASAKAVLTRALIEGLDQEKTQNLITSYCESRQLLA